MFAPEGTAPAIVDIAPTDAGFHSEGCGVWSDGPPTAVTPGQPFGAGTFLVGPEVAPGRYRSLSPDGCRWVRLSGFGGSQADVLDSGQVAIADIAPTDIGFHSSGCGVWSGDPLSSAAPGQPFGPGAYFVGAEIAPGRYYSRPDPDALQCRWQRLRDGERGLEESGDDRARGAPAVVDIAETDTAFHSDGCGTWTAALTPSVTPGDPFGALDAGTYVVGPEIAPGRYRTTTWVGDCSWRRLRGFGGTDGDIVARGNVGWNIGDQQHYHYRWPEESRTLIGDEGITGEIAPEDAGFHTGNCGAWTPAP